ncbi:hypothetical protein BDV39DRAFT_173791 [Aspergillus sergii]|uniref:Uncharacterized protein n=1 Tax=Aspergillus sergii TaxID=1034303 RepID=A0A5N6X6W6_9EURO|nr:hypothetical protein BDV39DRAFT_173791 [Aspergillus sergii]
MLHYYHVSLFSGVGCGHHFWGHTIEVAISIVLLSLLLILLYCFSLVCWSAQHCIRMFITLMEGKESSTLVLGFPRLDFLVY